MNINDPCSPNTIFFFLVTLSPRVFMVAKSSDARSMHIMVGYTLFAVI